MRASSGVFDEITEEGRLFQTGIVLGKNEFFRASLFIYKQGIWCTEVREMPWYFYVWSWGQILIRSGESGKIAIVNYRLNA